MGRKGNPKVRKHGVNREIMPWEKRAHPSLIDPKADLGRNSLLMDKQLEEISPKMPSDDRFAAMISKLQAERQSLTEENLQLKAVISTYEAKIKETVDMWGDELKAKNKRIADLKDEIEKVRVQLQRIVDEDKDPFYPEYEIQPIIDDIDNIKKAKVEQTE